jgi:hypothetical protein
MLRHYKKFLGVLVASLLLAIPVAATNSPIPGTSNGLPGRANAISGTVNYVQGQVTVAGQTVTPQTVVSVQMGPNEVLETGKGRAEVLLTPGVFLRVGDNSAVRMILPGWVNTRVELLRGQAIVEVTQLLKHSDVSVVMNGASTQLEKQGLYAFHADSQLVQVFDGRATVQQGNRHKDLDEGRELALSGNWKVSHFDPKSQAAQDPLYAWSSLRSEYDAEASAQSAQNIFVNGGAYWNGPGWYWNPYWDMYGFIPDDGIWYSPFGWPFYSPWAAWGLGFGYGWGYGGYGYGYGRGFGRGFGHGYFGHGYTGHGHIAGNAIGSGGRFAGHAGGGFGGRGFAGGMHGGFGGGGFGGMHGGFGGGGGGRR